MLSSGAGSSRAPHPIVGLEGHPIGAGWRIMGQIWEERGEYGTRSVSLSQSRNTKHRPTSAMACDMAIGSILPTLVGGGIFWVMQM